MVEFYLYCTIHLTRQLLVIFAIRIKTIAFLWDSITPAAPGAVGLSIRIRSSSLRRKWYFPARIQAFGRGIEGKGLVMG
jgi:hypothetical protein